ncbi:MAG: hypothetical protein HQK72_15040 [Desulfamplus sp.]|nr:hypothetical protein [Desulfamplus sp.]
MNRSETITETNLIQSSEKERSDIFVNICKRYTSIKLDYSIPADIKIDLQNMMQKEMEGLMQVKY